MKAADTIYSLVSLADAMVERRELEAFLTLDGGCCNTKVSIQDAFPLKCLCSPPSSESGN